MPHHNYSDKELKDILSRIVILCDTREQENQHILEYLDKHGIAHKSHKLDQGDYSVMIPAMPEYDFHRDLYFDDVIVIERKNSLDELAGNLTQGRERFHDEMIRMRDARKYIIVENATYDGMIEHKYSANFNEKAYTASMASFTVKYDLRPIHINKKHSGYMIHMILHHYVSSWLKGVM